MARIAIIGASTLLTLVAIPVLYYHVTWRPGGVDRLSGHEGVAENGFVGSVKEQSLQTPA
jgi:hypothetical protein